MGKIYTTIAGLRRLIREAKVQGVDEATARKIMAKFPKGMAKIGVSPDQIDSLPYLGSGTRGSVFAIGDKALKITNDTAEAQASSALIGNSNPNLTKYEKIFEFGDSGIYGILQEKLNKLPKEDADAFNKALVITGLPVWIAKSGYDFDKAKELSKIYVKKKTKEKLASGELKKEDLPKYTEDLNKAWNLMSGKYNMRGLVKTLGEYGIQFHDYQAPNVMLRDDGTLVLVDIGLSKMPGGGGEIDSIQEVLRIANSVQYMNSL